eukprot:6179120-Pleurochrysis_carterae.AAC.1
MHNICNITLPACMWRAIYAISHYQLACGVSMCMNLTLIHSIPEVMRVTHTPRFTHTALLLHIMRAVHVLTAVHVGSSSSLTFQVYTAAVRVPLQQLRLCAVREINESSRTADLQPLEAGQEKPQRYITDGIVTLIKAEDVAVQSVESSLGQTQNAGEKLRYRSQACALRPPRPSAEARAATQRKFE